MSAQTGDEIATDRQQFFEVEPEPETQSPRVSARRRGCAGGAGCPR
jgi:hypothetical protein